MHFDFSNTDTPVGGSSSPRSGSSGSDNGSDAGSGSLSDDVFENLEKNPPPSDEIIEIKIKPKVIPTDMKEIEKVRDDPTIKEVFDTYVPSNKKSPNGYAKLNGAANGHPLRGPIQRHIITDYMYRPKAYHWIHKETPV